MKIKLELLKNQISEFINDRIEDFEIDASEIANSVAIQMLAEIQKVIQNEDYSDFETIEEIVYIYLKNIILIQVAVMTFKDVFTYLKIPNLL